MLLARTGLFVAILLIGLLPTRVLAASPQDDLAQADQLVLQATQAVDAGDLASAQQAYQQFRTSWAAFEDDVRDASPDSYQAIEAAMRKTRTALQAQPPDPAAVRAGLVDLHAQDAAFIGSAAAQAGTTTPAASTASETTLASTVAELNVARSALARHDTAAASTSLQRFQRDWLAVETQVKAKSPAAYTATEDDMATAEAMLSGPAPREAQADAVLSRMQDRLQPIAESGTSYGLFDAFVIMLREGLEALLVVGALTAFVRRSGNGDKQGWIWGGAGAGVGLSIVLALLLQQAFARAGAGLGSELVEGIVGIVAAVMLFYVSYWLHSKARMGAWQSYIRARSDAALAGGSMLSLAVISFLAVFREGAETAVFYLGIAPSITPRDLWLGLGLGVLALVAVGVAVLLVGLRLPLRPFFLASSALIYYLGFKFIGTGLHSLQVSGVLPATPAPLPGNDVIGIYPTWETAVPQLAVLLIAAGVLWLSMRRQPGAANLASS
jgi:high-affinity iron transporter